MEPQITVTVDGQPLKEQAQGYSLGGSYDAASRLARETALWSPSQGSADLDLNWNKPLLDARARDMVRNEGYVAGAIAIHRDSIIGGRYILNANPNWRALGADEAWAEEFQTVVEDKFTLFAESQACWIDAQRRNTFTNLMRLAAGIYLFSGEVLATAEWIRKQGQVRPYSTAIQMIDTDRLSNPHDGMDKPNLRRGIVTDFYNAPVGYYIRSAHPSDGYMGINVNMWKYVPATKPWGRQQVIHIFEQMRPQQSRGVAEMSAALKEMRMTKKFRDITLQNAVVNAMYAAAIESELPPEVINDMLGAGINSSAATNTQQTGLAMWLEQLAQYSGGARGLQIDGVKIPHLFPNTKLNLHPVGTPGGVGTAFEQSLLRYLASTLGLSYEQLSRDYTNTNYSSARASMNETWKFMQSRKKVVIDRFATSIYALWLEEAINKGDVPLPKGMTAASFYEGVNKEAFCRCDWIGASRGQVDELKETEAAVLRIDAGLSTYEKEITRLGGDYREIFAQRAREEKLKEKQGLVFSSALVRPGYKKDPGSGDTQDGTTPAQDTNGGQP